MSNLKTRALVLRRTNLGEADRLIDFITESGPITALARSARRSRSKLAGGIEPFTLSEISVFHSEKSNRNTLTGAKMLRFYKNILGDFDSLTLASSFTKQVARALRQIDHDNQTFAFSPQASHTTQTSPHQANYDDQALASSPPSAQNAPLTFFSLLVQSYAALDLFIKAQSSAPPASPSSPKTAKSPQAVPSPALVETWFYLNLHILKGNQLNFLYDINGKKLDQNSAYAWDFSAEALTPISSIAESFAPISPSSRAPISAPHIKLARLILASPLALVARVKDVDALLPPLLEIAKSLS